MPKLDPFQAALNKYFPGAEPSTTLVERFLVLADNKYDLKPQQIAHANSVCSDDINNIQYPPLARRMLGPFALGGLNGFPFAGTTGLAAFSHHVPMNGALLIFFGPHIGITSRGELGEVVRSGQTKASSCCGAAQGALKKLIADEIIFCDLTSLDYQQNTIEQIFLHRKAEIVGPSLPHIVAATRAMFAATKERMDLLIRAAEFHGAKHVFTAGGIVINSDATVKEPGKAYIQPLHFCHWNPKTHACESILSEVQAAEL